MNKMVISTTKQKENIHEVKLFLVHGLFFQKKLENYLNVLNADFYKNWSHIVLCPIFLI